MSRSVLITLAIAFLTSASPPPAATCPAPVAVPQTVTAPGSTYYSYDEPPVRFAHVPQTPIKLIFGRAAIDRICGRPPCNMMFVGCQNGDTIVLPDPFTTDSATFAHTLRHELGHYAGWPATHGA